jgi:hypothetical protein
MLLSITDLNILYEAGWKPFFRLLYLVIIHVAYLKS